MTFNRAGVRGSAYRKKLNPVIVYIAYEGFVDEDEYFKALSVRIPKQFSKYMELIPVEKSSTDSDPLKVCYDLSDFLSKNKIKLNNDLNRGFIVIDKDHHFSGSHQRNLSECVALCSQKGINIICSNPSFDLWLLCHYTNVFGADDGYKGRVLENRGQFLKSELSRVRNGEDIHRLISRSAVAVQNSRQLMHASNNVGIILPDGLQTNVVKIFDIFEECGIPLPT